MPRSREIDSHLGFLEKCKAPSVLFYGLGIDVDCFSRPQPHKTLKKFLSPAFTVGSVDKLDTFFMESTDVLLQNYYNLVDKSNNPTKSIKDCKLTFHISLLPTLFFVGRPC